MRYKPNYPFIDPVLSILVCVAVFLGILLLYSADHGRLSLPIKQLIKGSMALGVFFLLAKTSERTIREHCVTLYILNIILLILTLYLGYHTKGAQRWLNLYFFRFEPSELIKITLPLALSSIIHEQGIPITHKNLIQGLVLIFIPFFLILKQPDLGTALIVLIIGTITIFLAGLDRKVLLAGILATLIGLPIFWHQLHDYQKQRVITLMTDGEDLQHHGYHIHQSKIAIGSGGVLGKGFVQGDQVQLGFVPEHKTDFILTVLSEEFGFVGNMLWITLILAMGLRSMYLGYLQHTTFNKLACISLGCSFMLNCWINMAMVCGLLPVVGVPLPLLSYGGTSFVATLISFALILKLGHTDPRRQYSW